MANRSRPVRTHNTAVVYYLKFRLVQTENIGFIVSIPNLVEDSLSDPQQDAAAAALFAACKIEDTLKKSKEILCAAHNMKLIPAEHVTPDDLVSFLLRSCQRQINSDFPDLRRALQDYYRS